MHSKKRWSELRILTGKVTLLLAALLCVSPRAEATVRLPAMLSDHGVLQREAPIHIWGWADPGEKISVSFHEQKLSASADELGKWSVYLMPEHAGGPYTLTVSGANTITLADMLVGDVWFASGQSNMEFPLLGFPGSAVMKNGAEEIAHATQPEIRLLRFERNSSPYPLEDQGATWTLCTPETAAKFSAVAYLFGRELNRREHVPIGLIDSTWGGTPVAAWVSMDSLAADAAEMPVFAARAGQADRQADEQVRIAAEKHAVAAAKAAGQPPPQYAWHPDPASWTPAGLYNAMIAPATGYSIKGAIWYQGESDSLGARAPLYQKTFPAMITDWRSHWGEGDFPFLFVQISSFTSTPVEFWGVVRDAQRRTLKLTNTAMAVTLDVGDPDNVHPSDKQTVGARLALAARAMVYGEKIEFSGPLFRQTTGEGNSMRVWFDHAEGLTAKGELLGFELAGSDRRFHPATARIEGSTVVVSAGGVDRPEFVRYAWANAPQANLYNGAGLPASTFTSEDMLIPPCPAGFPGGCPQ
jgi:sialate O-acetylesterase